MRIQPVSDLHLEFDPDHGKRFASSLPVLGDVLVLAGDVLPIRRPPHVREMLDWFCARFPRVIYVPGNHEYYRRRRRRARRCSPPARGSSPTSTCSTGR